MSPYSVAEEAEVSVSGLLKNVDLNLAITEESSQEDENGDTGSFSNQEPLNQPSSEMSFPRILDKFGFILNIDKCGNVYEIPAGEELAAKDRVPTSAEAQRTERREKKWNATVQSWERRRPKPLLRRLRKGIPDSCRGRVWALLAGGIPKPGLYQEIVQKTSDAMLENFKQQASRSAQDMSEPSNPTPTTSPTTSSKAREEYEREYGSPKRENVKPDSEDFAHTRSFRATQDTIERDIHRTYPRHDLFFEEDRHKKEEVVVEPINSLLRGLCDPELASLILNLESDLRVTSSGGTTKLLTSCASDITQTPGGQGALRRVLRAYSYYDREIGYCQGMNFIAGMFLTVTSEEEAFWLLVAVMHDKPCEMRGMFGEGMLETHKVLYVAEKVTHHYLPKLAKHFDKENIHVTMYATQWLLTQYTSSFKFDLVYRVWDCFLGEGWKIIYRVMLALLSQWQSQLLKMSFEEILAFFRELPDRVEGHVIMETALKIPLRTKVLVKYEKDFYAQQQTGSQ